MRNKECHRSNKELSDINFDNVWKCAAGTQEKHGFNLSLVDGLEEADPFLNQQFKDIVICIQGIWIMCHSAKQYILLVWDFN